MRSAPAAPRACGGRGADMLSHPTRRTTCAARRENGSKVRSAAAERLHAPQPAAALWRGGPRRASQPVGAGRPEASLATCRAPDTAPLAPRPAPARPARARRCGAARARVPAGSFRGRLRAGGDAPPAAPRRVSRFRGPGPPPLEPWLSTGARGAGAGGAGQPHRRGGQGFRRSGGASRPAPPQSVNSSGQSTPLVSHLGRSVNPSGQPPQSPAPR
jgi:hypothetical protein